MKMIMEVTQTHIDEWARDGEVELLSAATSLTFTVITRIIFGNDIRLDQEYDYHCPDGTVQRVSLKDLFMKTVQEVQLSGFRPINLVFPFIRRNHFGAENRRIYRNIESTKEGFRQFLKATKDTESIYKQIESLYTDQEKLLDDLLVLLFAGHDTTSHAITASIYLMLKHPDKQKIVKEELEAALAGRKIEDLNLQEINDLEYCGKFIRETLRLDPPAKTSIPYVVQ